MDLDLGSIYEQLCNSLDPYSASDRSILNEALMTTIHTFRSAINNENCDVRIILKDSLSFSIGYKTMGRFDVLDLITLDDLEMVSDYEMYRGSGYVTFIDIGANIGFHSLAAFALGFNVEAYEPDSSSFAMLKGNFALSQFNCNNNHHSLHEVAIGKQLEEIEFIRLVDNPFGNHVGGAKKDLYGPMERTTVCSISASSDLNLTDKSLVKIDAEGSDHNILEGLFANLEMHSQKDIILFLGDWREETREQIYKCLNGNNKLAFNRQTGRKITSLEDLPPPRSSGYVTVFSVESNLVFP